MGQSTRKSCKNFWTGMMNCRLMSLKSLWNTVRTTWLWM